MGEQNSHLAEITDILNTLPNMSPVFRMWIAEALQKQQLETIIAAVIQSGNVGNEKEAFYYINELTKDVSLDQPYLTSFDLWGLSKPKNIIAALERLVKGKDERPIRDAVWRFHGIIGHMVIPELLTGNLFKRGTSPKVAEKNKNQLSLFSETPSNQQLSLFDDNSREQSVLATISNDGSFLKTAGRIWKKTIPLLEKENNPSRLFLHHNEISKLYCAADQIFGDYFRRIKRGHGLDNSYLTLLTLMSWLSAIYRRNKRKRILFREIPVLAKKHGFSGGKIDAIELRLINGKPPNQGQRNMLEKMTRQKFPSAGNLFLRLRQIFRGNLELVVIDWKFAVGDGSFYAKKDDKGISKFEWQIISPSDIQGSPLQKHYWQMFRYLTLASFDYHLLACECGILNRWPEDNILTKGEIVYFMPTMLPIAHEIVISSEQQEAFLTNEVAIKWNVAHRRAAIRRCDNLIIKNLIHCLEKNNHYMSIKKSNQEFHGELFPENESKCFKKNHAREMIDERRVFADKHNCIIEVAGKLADGTMKYEMHLDRLFVAIEEGRIATGHFFLPRGGKIRCIMSDHLNDDTPSMHLWLQEGMFKCFGCGARGVFALNSIPEDLKIPVRSPKWVRQVYAKTLSFIVADEKHIRIMGLAQEFLQFSFKKSKGEIYVINQRQLDSELAFQMGAGFGTEKLINGLLDAGFTYDDLIFYGFVNISSRITPQKGIVSLFKKRGMLDEEIRKQVDKKFKTGEILYGYPYSVLECRVTFPLELDGKINNFYGRSIEPDAKRIFFHRKLSTSKTGVPHGAFNADVLDSEAEEIIVVEGIIDALTLIQAGYPATLAIIGADNVIILEAIVRSGKKIAVALDYDESGQKTSEKLLERFYKKGKEDSRNFTADFAALHSEMEWGMDWNDWWKRCEKRKIQI